MTLQQASRIHFPNKSANVGLPIPIDIQGWTNWSSGNYLKVGSEAVTKLQEVVGQLEGLPRDAAKPNCDHLSLYRKRGRKGTEVNQQFARVRTALQDHDWGTVQGVSVRIKAVGTDCSECRVLAGVM